jgi:single-strand DNA-binding protein
MVNKVILIGRVGRDPEMRYTGDGTPVATFSMAMTEKWKDKESTTWLNIVAWKKLGEIVGEYVKKGALLYVEGKVQVREYEARDGAKRKVFEIVAHQIKMLGGKSNGGQSSGGEQHRPADDDFVHEEGGNNGEPSEWDDIPL